MLKGDTCQANRTYALFTISDSKTTRNAARAYTQRQISDKSAKCLFFCFFFLPLRVTLFRYCQIG